MIVLLALLYTVGAAAAEIIVGGVSAGCYMAVQMHFAYSSMVSGLACIAGGPYYCAQGDVALAIGQCMSATDSPLINVDYLEGIVRNTAATGFIDPVSGLSGTKAWFYSATNDTIVAPTVVVKNIELYSRFVLDPATQLRAVLTHTGEHAQVTADYGADCMNLGTPYINNCDYDAAGEQLEFLLGGRRNRTYDGTIIQFNQTDYMPVLWDPIWGLQRQGYAYVPNNCSAGCDLAVIFHGCLQTLDDIGTEFVEHAGYNGYDRLMVIYPQALANDLNPHGCFDWWGYTGADYASNIGVQMTFVRSLINRFKPSPLPPFSLV